MGRGRSRIEFENVPPSARGVPSLESDTLLVPGVAPWGPLGPTVCTTWDDFKTKFGGMMASYYAGIAIDQYFRGRGRRGGKVIFNRIFHWDGNGDPATGAKAAAVLSTSDVSPSYAMITGTVLAPFALENNDTLILYIDGEDPANKGTATFTAVAATEQNQLDEPFNIVPDSTMDFSINAGDTQQVTFRSADFDDITAATAEEVAAILNAQLLGVQATVTGAGKRVTLTTDQKGSGASINLVESGGGPYGTDANSIIQFNVATVTGSGDAADASSVSLAEVKAWLEGEAELTGLITVSSDSGYLTIRTNTSGSTGSIHADATSTAETKMGLDTAAHTGTDGGVVATLDVDALYYGTVGNEYSVSVTAATNGETSSFDLVVYRTGYTRPVERHRNLNMDAADDTNYAIAVVNTLSSRSKCIRLEDKLAAGSTLQRRPVNVSTTYLTGGDNGLTGLTTTDYIGSPALRTGLYGFNLTNEGDLLIIPDSTATAVQNAATTYCGETKMGKIVFVPDPPAGSDDDAIVTHVQSLDVSEARTAMYWPRVKIANPDKTLYGLEDNIVVPPSGLIAGRMARNTVEDVKQQMWRQPGNQTYGYLNEATGLETETVLDENVQDYVTDNGINPIVAGLRNVDGRYGVWINDVMAGDRSGNFISVGEIRGVAHLRRTHESYIEEQRTQGNTEVARERVQRTLAKDLSMWTANEVFETKDTNDAFYVNADVPGEGINNAVARDNEEFNVLEGIMTARASRFVKILFTRDSQGTRSRIQKDLAATSGQ